MSVIGSQFRFFSSVCAKRNIIVKKYIKFATPVTTYVSQSESKSAVAPELVQLFPDKLLTPTLWNPTPAGSRPTRFRSYLELCKLPETYPGTGDPGRRSGGLRRVDDGTSSSSVVSCGPRPGRGKPKSARDGKWQGRQSIPGVLLSGGWFNEIKPAIRGVPTILAQVLPDRDTFEGLQCFYMTASGGGQRDGGVAHDELHKCAKFVTPVTSCVTQTKPKSTIAPEFVQQKIRKVFPEKLDSILWKLAPSRSRLTRFRSYLELCKIPETSFVVATVMVGYAVAPAAFDWTSFTCSTLGVAVLSSGAFAMNQFHETPYDSQMARTRERVLISGRLTPVNAVLYAAGSCAAGFALLCYGTNPLTTSLALGDFVLYSLIYTCTKRLSIYNTWVGAVVDALPALIGCLACANTLGPAAWWVAAVVYVWEFPRVNTLAWHRLSDYSKVGHRMMAVIDPAKNRRVTLRHTAALLGLSVVPPLLDMTSWWFVAESAPLNFYFLYLGYQFYKNKSDEVPKKLYKFSYLYLPLLLAVFVINQKKGVINMLDSGDEPDDDAAEQRNS